MAPIQVSSNLKFEAYSFRLFTISLPFAKISSCFSLAKEKQEEILAKGREIVKSLNEYASNFKFDDTCIGAIESMCKYQLSNYLKNKENLTIATGVEMLEGNVVLREIANDVTANLNRQPNIKAFLRMQGEIIDIISKQLQTLQFR